MSSGSASPPHSGPQSSTTTGLLTRRNTTSSVGSEPYTPLPPGKYFLDLHGSCPRCHHQHNGVQVKVNTKSTADDTNRVSHVHCEGCSAKWLAFGARNTTRISLLSTLSSKPDPVETEVRNTVIAMIKSATAMSAAVGSPRLAGISESPVDNTASPNSTILPADGTQLGRTEERSRSISFHLPVGRDGTGRHQPPSPTGTTPFHPHHGGLHPRRSFSHMMTRMKSHLPILARFSAKRLRQKNPRGTGQNDAQASQDNPPTPIIVAATEQSLAPNAPEQQPASPDGNDSEARREATNFLSTLQSVNLPQMDEPKRIHWGRETLTTLRKQRQQITSPRDDIDTGTQVNAEDLVTTESIRTQHHRHAYDLLHLGSHHGLFDRWSNDFSLRSRPISVSTDRTSEAITAVPDNGARFSWVEHLQRERRGSNTSLRTSSIRGFGRLSFDSIRSTRAVRNPSTARGSSMNRRSSRSMGHLSTLALPDQTVAERSDDDAVTASRLPNGSRNASPNRQSST